MESRGKIKRDDEPGTKIKRLSQHRVKKVNRVPTNKEQYHKSHRLSTRSKQHSVKARLVYKKDSIKTMNSNNLKNEISHGRIQINYNKIENKENNFIQANSSNKLKLNRTSSGRNNNMKSMSGIRKLYTLKTNNSNRRLESQSYRDFNNKHKNNENSKNDRIINGNQNIYHSTMNSKTKRISKRKGSSSETPKLRVHNEGLFTGIREKLKNKEDIGDKENVTPNNTAPIDETRILKKPQNSSLSSKQIKPSSNFKNKPPSASSRIEYYNKIDKNIEKKLKI